MGGGKLKKLNGDAGKKIAISIDNSSNLEIHHPVFCLKYLHKKYDLDKCEDKEKIALITRMRKLSAMTWKDIQLADKHGFGTEKLPQHIINASIPSHLSKDEVLLAFRFDGKKPMVGYRNSFIFHVLYLDRDFTLYAH